MPDYDKRKLGKQARELGFIRDTLEKVFRLSEILKYINNDPLLREGLALKGGTAINMTIFNLPRLSVDIDLDYTHTMIQGKKCLRNAEESRTASSNIWR